MYQKPAINSYVVLTAEGSKAHRKWNKNKARVLFGVGGAFLLPAIIPSAGVGVTMGGGGFAVGEALQGVVGGVVGGLAGGNIESGSESGSVGQVLKVKNRLHTESGWDVLVRWNLKDDEGRYKTSDVWHQAKHLEPIKKDPTSSF